MIVLPSQAGELLQKGLIGVIPTESVYGIVAKADNISAVERIYKVKDRPANKPCIVLIAKPSDMLQFDVDDQTIALAAQYWPGKVSVVVPCGKKAPVHLTKGTNTIAFRVGGTKLLQDILAISGPLIAPSANPDSMPPAISINQAFNYFGEKVNFYTDGGICNSKPSKVVDLVNGRIFRK